MFDFIRALMTGGGAAGGAGAGSAVDRTQLAAAVILLEAAGADYDCSDEEIAHVLRTLREQFGIPAEFADELLELARAERSRAVDLFHFTRELNARLSREEKMALMEGVWRILYADGRLDRFEDHFAHKLAGLLRISNREKIDAKLRVREEMKKTSPHSLQDRH